MRKETAEKIRADMRHGYASAAAETSVGRVKLYGQELKRFSDYLREKESVLDVGCGDGRAYDILKEKRIAYAGIDLSNQVVTAARAHWNDQAVFEVGDLLELPVPDGRYDAVLALGILHHVPSAAYRLQAVKELARALRPGGYLMTASWNLWRMRYWWVHVHQLFGLRNGWDFGDVKITWKRPFFPRFYHAFSIKEMRNLCEAANLDVVEQSYVRNGETSDWIRGENLVMIARKK